MAKAKAKTAERGYGAVHRRARATAKRDVDRGDAYCWRCARWIDPAEPWDLGHDDHDRSIYRGPEHVSCNRATSGRSQEASRRVTSRQW